MGNTYDTSKLAERPLNIEPIQLPEGMGIGALRHTIAAGVRNNWNDIRTTGPYATIATRPTDFLGAADNVEDLADANADTPLDNEILHDLLRIAEGWVTRSLRGDETEPTLNYAQEVIEDLIRSHLIGRVQEHVRYDILAQTGIDLESEPGKRRGKIWMVK